MEIKKKAEAEVIQSEAEKLSKIPDFVDRMKAEGGETPLTKEQADALLEGRLGQQEDTSDTEIGTPYQAKVYLDKAEMYAQKYRQYMRQANDLESRIDRKKEPESRRSEVRRLERQASEMKSQSERYKRYAQQLLNQR